jgi:hypothetical protein
MQIKSIMRHSPIVVAFLFVIVSQSFAQTDDISPLPADLVFGANGQATDEILGREPYVLALLDGETLQISELYRAQPGQWLVPISWSRQGDLLAFYQQDRWTRRAQVCIVSISGELQTCFEDSVPDYYTDSTQPLKNHVTWSENGASVYFVVQDHQAVRLVEGDVLSGKVVKTIYETDYSVKKEAYEPPVLSWTPNLSHVAVAVGYPGQSGFIVNLETGESLSLETVFQPYLTEIQEAEREALGHRFICPDISPAGSYLTALVPAYPTAFDRLIVFDKDGSIWHEIEPEDHQFFCPTWTHDEQGFYMYVYATKEFEVNILYYSLADGERVKSISSENRLGVPLILSPEGGYIAYDAPAPPLGGEEVNVLYPDGTIVNFNTPYRSSWAPVWVYD